MCVGRCWVGLQEWLLLSCGRCCCGLLTFMTWIDRLLLASTGNVNDGYGKRQEAFGNTYVAHGNLVVCDHDEVASILASPQVRGNYFGGVLELLRKYLPDDFLLFLHDPASDDEARENRHQRLHDYIWHKILIPAQTRVTGARKEVLQAYIDDFMKEYAAAGFPQKNDSAIAPLLEKMVVRYVTHALFDIVLPDEIVKIMIDTFIGQSLSSSYVVAIAPPLSFLVCSRKNLLRNIEKMLDAIIDSPALENYIPAEDNCYLEKREFSFNMLVAAGFAGMLGSYTLARTMLAKLPDEYPLDLDDRSLMVRAVLEIARIDTAVGAISVVLTEPRQYVKKNGRTITAPAGTVVAACIHGANHDETVFPNSKTFDPTRENLVEKTLVFNSSGFSPTGAGRRTCVGRNVVIQMCSDLLAAKRRAQNEAGGTKYGSIS